MNKEKSLGKFEIENGVLTDVKEKPLSKKIKNIVDSCADKTDIWDNERWAKTRKLLIKEFTNETAHKIDRILIKWKDKCKRLEIMSGDVGYFELKAIIEREIGDLK